MSRLQPVSEPTIIGAADVGLRDAATQQQPARPVERPVEEPPGRRHTFTGSIGAACMRPLRAIIRVCVALRIHPNTLTLIGVIINVAAAWALAYGRFITAFVIMLVANIFDFIDGKVAHILNLQSRFGAFWDSTLDRFSDLAL